MWEKKWIKQSVRKKKEPVSFKHRFRHDNSLFLSVISLSLSLSLLTIRRIVWRASAGGVVCIYGEANILLWQGTPRFIILFSGYEIRNRAT